MSENVSLTRSGPVATVTLNRPDRRNSLSDPLLIELGAALAELRDDVSTRVVVLTGAPPVFSSGAHSEIKRGMSEEERRRVFNSRQSQFRRYFERVTALLENLEQATICAINGHAIGGGWGLTLPCDFRIAAESAQFWFPEVDLGSPLGTGSTTRLIRLAGPARAKEMVMTCKRYSAAELAAVGLVNQVVPLADLEGAVAEWAALLLGKPFKALAEVKARVNTISITATPNVNAMTEAFLARE
jgi:enoyl-CoA hydratase